MMRRASLPALAVPARCVAAGLCLVAAVPPWGWWPLAFVGVAMVDRLLANQPARARAARMWLVAAAWLFPGTVWMVALTAPGYVIAQVTFAAMFALAAVAVPPGRGRRIALPGAFVLAEWWRWSWPFGGVPLATIPMGQVASPLAPTARTLGQLVIVALVVCVGVALSAALERSPRTVALNAAIVLVALGWAAVAPEGHRVATIEAAAVQGGGPQGTRSSPEQDPEVLRRHVEASRDVATPVELVVWPENVVNPRPPYRDLDPSPRYLDLEEATDAVTAVARDLDATLVAGRFHAVDDTTTVNYAEVRDGDGEAVGRYDKVRIVPFGEYVPLRSLLEPVAGDALPPRDVRPGTGTGFVDTPAGPLGISISWEIFFDHRARAAVRDGAQVLLNPTNGASYWLSIVQSQQVASSQLRALETGRQVIQAAPTGFSAIIDHRGDVVHRTGISEAAVLQDTVELRDGQTLATRLGSVPMGVLALILVGAAHLVANRVPAAARARLSVAGRRPGPVPPPESPDRR